MLGGRQVDVPSIKEKVSFSTNNEKIRDLFSTHLENFQLEVVIDDGDGWGWHP